MTKHPKAISEKSQPNFIGFRKRALSICGFKFFQIPDLRQNPNSNKTKCFNFSEVQIQIAGKTFEPWLINKYFCQKYGILMNIILHSKKIH